MTIDQAVKYREGQAIPVVISKFEIGQTINPMAPHKNLQGKDCEFLNGEVVNAYDDGKSATVSCICGKNVTQKIK